MKKQATFAESIKQAFQPSPRAVVGLVDDLLSLCREQDLELDWHAERCRVRTIGVEPEESVQLPIPKAVFRAVLARLAALCNECHAGSMSPYAGEGELTVGTNPPGAVRVMFTNTPNEQRVQLTRVAVENRNGEIQPTKNGALLDSTVRKD